MLSTRHRPRPVPAVQSLDLRARLVAASRTPRFDAALAARRSLAGLLAPYGHK